MTHEELVSGVDAQIRWISEARESLYQEARATVDGYWAHHYKANGELNVWERSVLGVRVKRSSGDDFYIQWFWNKWIKDKQDRKRPLSQHIRKGKGYAYPASVLRKHAKEWEVDLVLSLERDFAVIRQEARELKLAELALRRLRAVVQDAASPDNANDTEAETEE